jgi:predicted nucleic acid-binding protein
MAELAAGVELGRVPAADWSWLTEVALSDAEMAHASRLGELLGQGEAQCIALAASRGWLVVTDDRDARRTAQSLGIMVSGTLGALMNLVRGQMLPAPEADHLLRLMKEYGYRSPVASLSQLIGG